jgi:hypothetical protein
MSISTLNTPLDSLGLSIAILSDNKVIEIVDAIATIKIAPSTYFSYYYSY